MVLYTSISRDIYTFPASPVPAEHPVRPCNLVRVLQILTRAKTPAQAGSEGRKSFITCRVIRCQGHVPAPGISLHKPQLLRSFQRRTESQRTSLPSVPSHCTNTNTSLLFSFALPSRGLEVAEKNPYGSAGWWLVPRVRVCVLREGQEASSSE